MPSAGKSRSAWYGLISTPAWIFVPVMTCSEHNRSIALPAGLIYDAAIRMAEENHYVAEALGMSSPGGVAPFH